MTDVKHLFLKLIVQNCCDFVEKYTQLGILVGGENDWRKPKIETIKIYQFFIIDIIM